MQFDALSALLDLTLLTMRVMKSPLITFLAVSTFHMLVEGGNQVWNRDSLPNLDSDSLLGDAPVPTLPPLLSNDIYPYLPRFPVKNGLPGRSKANTVHSGRLDVDYRQTLTCSDPNYILSCPVTDTLPCCPSAYPICCPQPSTNCCVTGSFCVGTHTCCQNGHVACGEGCCDAGSTCCNDSQCCPSGYTCLNGNCVNPTLSSQSVHSLQSLASVQSISLASASSVSVQSASSQSVASISSALAAQPGFSNTQEVHTASVLPSDDRIKYDPPNSWIDSSSSSGVANCNNGTKYTTQNAADFTFIFEGTAITLFIIPSSAGGPFTVQIDGEPATSYNGAQTGGTPGDLCIPNPIFARNNLTESPHEITVRNGGAVGGLRGGTLEFNGITYTGKGAFGTTPKSSKASPAVIGGSVGGAVGAVALIGGIVFFLWYKRNHQDADSAIAARPMSQTQTTPYSADFQNQSPPVSPGATSGYQPSAAYSGMAPMDTQQPLPSQPQSQQMRMQQQQQQPWGQQWAPWPQQQHQYQQQQSYDRPISGHSNIAPLPMWVERARMSGRDDNPSVTSVGHTNASSQALPQQQPNPYYGSHYSANARVNDQNVYNS